MSKITDAVTLCDVFVELSLSWFEKEYPESLELHSRNTIFTSGVTMWLMIAQKGVTKNTLASSLQELKRVGEISQLSKLAPGSRKFSISDISNNPGGLSQARSRLSLQKVEELSDHLSQEIEKEHKDISLLYGYRTYIIDGSTIELQKNESICKEFPPHSNHFGSFQPAVRIVVVHNLVTGNALRPELGNIKDSEQKLSQKIIARLPKNSLILGDSNFGVFSVVFNAAQVNQTALVRLTEKRAQKILGKKLIKQDGDHSVVWTPSKAERLNHELPDNACIKGRVVVITHQEQGRKAQRFCFFTNSKRLAPIEILDIYKRRWIIESDLLSIKKTVCLHTIYAKSPDMIRKEIILGVVAYSLIRTVIARGAKELNLEPREISFSRAAEFAVTIGIKLQKVISLREIDHISTSFVVGLRQLKHPNRRKKRIEPRALVPRRLQKYPRLRCSRQEARANIIKLLSA